MSTRSRLFHPIALADVEEGLSRREAARRLRLSASSAVRWVKLHELTGSVAAQPRSPLERLQGWLINLIASELDLTLEAIVTRVLETHRLKSSTSAVDRFYRRHKISFKKASTPANSTSQTWPRHAQTGKRSKPALIPVN